MRDGGLQTATKLNTKQTHWCPVAALSYSLTETDCSEPKVAALEQFGFCLEGFWHRAADACDKVSSLKAWQTLSDMGVGIIAKVIQV